MGTDYGQSGEDRPHQTTGRLVDDPIYGSRGAKVHADGRPGRLLVGACDTAGLEQQRRMDSPHRRAHCRRRRHLTLVLRFRSI